ADRQPGSRRYTVQPAPVSNPQTMTRIRTFVAVAACLALAALGCASSATAQSTTGTVTGHVTDSQNAVLPGVTVRFMSDSLQGSRIAVTSQTGDYILPLLPPGVYKVAFDLGGFQRQEKTAELAPTQVLALDAVLGLAPVSESVQVTGLS